MQVATCLVADGRTLTWYTDLDRLEKYLIGLAPVDSAVIKEVCNAARLLGRHEPPVQKPMEHMGFLGGLKMLGMLRWVRATGKYGKISIQSFASRFEDPFLREAFPLVFEDLPDMVMTGLLITMAQLHKRNAGVPRGGSLEFAKAIERRYLTRDVRALHGELARLLHGMDGHAQDGGQGDEEDASGARPFLHGRTVGLPGRRCARGGDVGAASDTNHLQAGREAFHNDCPMNLVMQLKDQRRDTCVTSRSRSALSP